MANLAFKLAKRVRADKAMERYRTQPFDMVIECFATNDPKAPGGPKIARPWGRIEAHERIFYDLVEAKYQVIGVHKSKQIRMTWLGAARSAVGHLLEPGFFGVHQSHTDALSIDIVRNRVYHLLTHLRGPLEDMLPEGDISLSAGEITLKKFLDQEVSTRGLAIPSGPAKWRQHGPTFGHLDEWSYHHHQGMTFDAALSACEGASGVLLVVFTGSYGTVANDWAQEQIEMAATAHGREVAIYNAFAQVA